MLYEHAKQFSVARAARSPRGAQWLISGKNISLLTALLLTPLAALHAAEIHIKDFGATGNATADDTAALEKAVAALVAAPKPAVLRFEAGRTYRIATGTGYAIRIQDQERIRIEGGGATLLLGTDRRDVLLKGNRLGDGTLPAARIRIEDRATRNSVKRQ